jgi:type IV pilus assembly protein PilQ
MKTKILIVTLLGCLVWQQGALSQTGTTATNPSAPDAVAPASQPAAVTDTTAGAGTTAPATGTDATATAPSATPGTGMAEAVSTDTAATNTPAEPAAETTDTNETAKAASPAPTALASIPLIQFQDVPITTAIENLARQAGINYLIDPKIGYGQPDQNGQIKPEPTLSIRWENVTAEQALMALLDNYNLQLAGDRRTQISRITTKDPMAPPPLNTRVLQLKYASTSNMVDSIQASFTDRRSKVLPDARTSQLVVVATDGEQEAVDKLIDQLDKPTRQVLIETKLVQVASTPSTKKGVDWTGTLDSQVVTFGNGLIQPGGSASTVKIPGDSSSAPFGGHGNTTTPSSSESTVLNIIQGAGGVSWNTVGGFSPGVGFLNASGARAVLSFLNSSYDAQVVSTPRVVTLDNQTATIEVTRSYPVINMSGGTQNSAGSSSITYSNIGTILQVTPRISANDFIWLKVIPIVSSFFGNVKVTVEGGAGNASSSYPVPLFDYRKIDSQVMIPNGNTLVMGGLLQDKPTASYTKVPVLGDIPGLGWAFRSEAKSMDKDNLIIFMTPTIIKDTDYQQAAPSNFLQSKPNMMKSPMNPNSIWDSAQPLGDWSNPAPVPGEFTKK